MSPIHQSRIRNQLPQLLHEMNGHCPAKCEVGAVDAGEDQIRREEAAGTAPEPTSMRPGPPEMDICNSCDQ